ncbi:MAG: protease HtpX [Pseudomonadota bacterium]
MKRFFLFFATNIAIMLTISIVVSLTGAGQWITAKGIDYSALMVFCLIWGMGGSFISLLISKWMAKRAMGVRVIDPVTSTGNAQRLVQRVYNLAGKAGLSKMPEVGIYESPEVNAFATGPSRSNSLVAVSSGLLDRMNDDEVEGVLAHEIAHIANGDMVTMTLLQGVVNAFVMFFARIAAFAISQAMRKDNEENRGFGFMEHMIVFAFEIVFGIIGSTIVMAFSRHREFRADKGGSDLAGNGKMIAALEKLRSMTQLVDTEHSALAAFKISGGTPKGIRSLFMTHPSLESRISALKEAR